MKKQWILAAACLSGLAFSAPATAQTVERSMATGDDAATTSSQLDSSLSSGTEFSRGRPTTSGGSTSVPEPGMLGLFGLGLLAVGYARYRRRTRA